MRRGFIWQAAFMLVASLAAILAAVSGLSSISMHTLWGVALVSMCGLGWWSRIALEHYGSLNLSPVVFLVTAWAYGLSDGVFVAALGPLSGFLIQRLAGRTSGDAMQAMAVGGEAAASLIIGYLLVSFSATAPGTTVGLWGLLELSFATLLAVFLLGAFRIATLERVGIARLLPPLARRALPHLGAILLATPVVWLTFALIGPLGIVLSVVVMIETYYPWKLLGEQRDLFLKSLQMMSNAVDFKDPYTAHHSKRVADYSVMVARALGISEDEVARIRIGALMHDIGKIGVPGRIIRKPSKLSDEEMDLMKSHVEAGSELIKGLEVLEESSEIVRHHHENYDGSGYPAGLVAETIPLGARIVFVADAFDALTTDRPYRKGRSRSEALKVLKENTRRQFDPNIVEAFEKVSQTLAAA